MALTKKQEMFCYEVIKQSTLSAAYRIAYDTSGMTNKQVWEESSKLYKNPKVVQRTKELKDKVEKKELYSLEQSIKRDINLIERYESALDVLENNKSTPNEVEAAERTIKYIGASGYSSAQDRLSKQNGFYEKHNKQKNLIEMTDEELDAEIKALERSK